MMVRAQDRISNCLHVEKTQVETKCVNEAYGMIERGKQTKRFTAIRVTGRR